MPRPGQLCAQHRATQTDTTLTEAIAAIRESSEELVALLARAGA